MKKFMALLLMLGMIFLMAACDSDTEIKSNQTTSNDSDTTLNVSRSDNTSKPFERNTSKLNLSEKKISKRDYFSNPTNAETVTLLIYLCGSDLESNYGCATYDIEEILNADIGDNVNIIMETGGAKYWDNNTIPIENTRYQLTNDGLTLLDDSLGNRDMTDPETLSNFINYGVSNYPADRYMLILWDHGGGSLGGFAYDQRFPSSSAMTLSEIDQALSTSDVYFDFIGFDACLMATLETAFVLEEYTDYMIASQMLEPGDGWYYTNWISTLSSDPSISIPNLAEELIDDYVDMCIESDYYTEATLSLVDLTKIYSVIDALDVFIESAQNKLIEKDFAAISKARADVSWSGSSTGTNSSRSIAQDYDHVDIIQLARNLSSYNGANELISAVEGCVVYENKSSAVSNRNGVNFYFPYTDISLFNDMLPIYSDIGFSSKYVEFVASFASIMAGGQSSNSGSGISFGSGNNFGGNDDFYSEDDYDDWWSDFDWFDSDLYDYYSDEEYYDENVCNTDELEVFDKNGDWVLSLSDRDWETITTIEIAVLYDNDEGYLNLGYDNTYEFDNDGDLLIGFDNTWIALDGQIVSFYFESEEYHDDGSWYTYGYVPAYINDEYAEIIVEWNNKHPNGYVAGYRVQYDSLVSQKGLFQLEDGDAIEFICDYYDYDLYYEDWVYISDTIYYNGDFEVSYDDIGYGECLVYYCLTDIYGNTYFTESIVFHD